MKRKQPITIRTNTLADVLDTIQATMKQIGGDKQKGAEMALNAVREKFGISKDGEQMELFDNKEQ